MYIRRALAIPHILLRIAVMQGRAERQTVAEGHFKEAVTLLKDLEGTGSIAVAGTPLFVSLTHSFTRTRTLSLIHTPIMHSLSLSLSLSVSLTHTRTYAVSMFPPISSSFEAYVHFLRPFSLLNVFSQFLSCPSFRCPLPARHVSHSAELL